MTALSYREPVSEQYIRGQAGVEPCRYAGSRSGRYEPARTMIRFEQGGRNRGTGRRRSLGTILGIVAFLGIVALSAALAAVAGCSTNSRPSADPEPFKKAVAEYLERNNMAMALKEIKHGPTVQGNQATLTASLTHASLGGPAVTWQIRFERDQDGRWKAVGHQ